MEELMTELSLILNFKSTQIYTLFKNLHNFCKLKDLSNMDLYPDILFVLHFNYVFGMFLLSLSSFLSPLLSLFQHSG